MVRNPAVAGAFYPSEKAELENILKRFVTNAKKEKTIGVVVPHAGYEYSGKTSGAVYSTVKPDFQTVVLIGPNHNAQGLVGVSTEEWKTPLGKLKPDTELANELTKDSIIAEDSGSQVLEHSLEVQLPFLQYMFKDFKIVPISINPYHFDVSTCREVGEAVAAACSKSKRRVLIVASSDFTHYGSMYGYEPFVGGDVLGKIKKMDMEVIEQIINLNPEKVIEICEQKRLTICGYGAIAAMLFASKRMGAKSAELVDYSTSFEVSKKRDAIVGYAGIAVR